MTAWDAIVVGSGFGGAVAAARLAERGLKVLILERGAWWVAESTTIEGRATLRDQSRLLNGVRYSAGAISVSVPVRRDGLYELHQFDHLTCVVASGVGGGSLVYTDMQVQPSDRYFDRWPAEITGEEMRPHFDSVRAMLSPSPIPFLPAKIRAFERALAAAGCGPAHFPDLALDFDGAEYRRKTLDATYIPLAQRHSACVRARCEVTALDRHPRGWRVRYRDRERGRTAIASAPRLILAAGTLGTLRLLFAARDRHGTLPRLGPALGRAFTPNGDMLSLVRTTGHRASHDQRPPISAYRTESVDGREFLTAEVGSPIHHFTPPRFVRRLMPDAPLLFAMGSDAIASSVGYDGRELRINADRDDDPGYFELVRRHAQGIGAGYDGKVVMTNFPFGGRSRRLLTVHPLGGARVSDGPEHGVVDHAGQVHGHPGLFIADGSILPGAPGIPPSMTIAAFAERQAALIAADDIIHQF